MKVSESCLPSREKRGERRNCPGTYNGKLVADLIIKEESPAQLDHLNLERFMQ